MIIIILTVLGVGLFTLGIGIYKRVDTNQKKKWERIINAAFVLGAICAIVVLISLIIESESEPGVSNTTEYNIILYSDVKKTDLTPPFISVQTVQSDEISVFYLFHAEDGSKSRIAGTTVPSNRSYAEKLDFENKFGWWSFGIKTKQSKIIFYFDTTKALQ
ncbi:hypothetical protein KAS08_00425 [Candidatus Pacearchaeota archaeon]|nr:hypothetical protein [Candidatus Pacearchaeota archaeon]